MAGSLRLEIGNQHESQHGKKEDDGVQQQPVGSFHRKEGSEHHLRQFVGFGIGDDEKHERRNKGVFCLEQNIHRSLLDVYGFVF